jgi:hypothetical protein
MLCTVPTAELANQDVFSQESFRRLATVTGRYGTGTTEDKPLKPFPANPGLPCPAGSPIINAHCVHNDVSSFSSEIKTQQTCLV